MPQEVNRIVVVTGSRDWRYPGFVSIVLNAIYARSGKFTLYHGDCRDRFGNPCGADHHADTWAKSAIGMLVKRYPADWATHGYSAGPIRNREMVEDALAAVDGDLQSIQLVAFQRKNSRGTQNCINEARRLNIYDTVWTEDDVPEYMQPETRPPRRLVRGIDLPRIEN